MLRKTILVALAALSLTATFAATGSAFAWCNDGYQASSYSYGYTGDSGYGDAEDSGFTAHHRSKDGR